MIESKCKAVHISELEATFTTSTAKLACIALVPSMLILKPMIAAGISCPRQPKISGSALKASGKLAAASWMLLLADKIVFWQFRVRPFTTQMAELSAKQEWQLSAYLYL